MSDPIVFISHNAVKNGKIDGLKKYYHEVMKDIEKQKPGTLMHLAFFNADSSEMTIVHLLADADAMDAHMVGTAEAARGIASGPPEPTGFWWGVTLASIIVFDLSTWSRLSGTSY